MSCKCREALCHRTEVYEPAVDPDRFAIAHYRMRLLLMGTCQMYFGHKFKKKLPIENTTDPHGHTGP